MKTIVWDYAAKAKGKTETQNTALLIGMLFVHNVVGLAIGVIVGLAAWPFKYIQDKSYCMWLKCIYGCSMGVAFIISAEYSSFTNAKYIACLSLGYTLNRVWDGKKPAKEMG